MNNYLITYEKVDGTKSSIRIADITPDHARDTLKTNILGVSKILSTVKIKKKLDRGKGQ